MQGFVQCEIHLQLVRSIPVSASDGYEHMLLAGSVVQEPVPDSRSHTVDFGLSCWVLACTPTFVRWMLPVNLAVTMLIWEVPKLCANLCMLLMQVSCLQ